MQTTDRWSFIIARFKKKKKKFDSDERYNSLEMVMILSLILLKIHYRFNHFITSHGRFYFNIYRKTAITNT